MSLILPLTTLQQHFKHIFLIKTAEFQFTLSIQSQSNAQ
jgi:hypothetical protein